MGRIIAIVNQKGGVGKTTTNINLSAALAARGNKVLTIDCDSQGNASSGLGIDKDNVSYSLYNLLIGECDIEDVIIKVECIENLFVIPANSDLIGAEIELIDIQEREMILKNAVESIKDEYDYIIIDCPPALGILTLNALNTAQSVIVPIQCEYYALEGLTQLLHTINIVNKKMNNDLELEGIVFTMFDSRTNLSIQVVEEVKKYLGKNVYYSIVPRNVRLSEAPSHGLPINLYDSRSKGAEAYEMLADIVINRGV